MRVLAQLTLALCLVLSGAVHVSAQTDKEKYNLKPLLPPILPLPPNALVTPGGATAPSGSEQSPFNSNSATQSPSAPGLKITIPR